MVEDGLIWVGEVDGIVVVVLLLVCIDIVVCCIGISVRFVLVLLLLIIGFMLLVINISLLLMVMVVFRRMCVLGWIFDGLNGNIKLKGVCLFLVCIVFCDSILDGVLVSEVFESVMVSIVFGGRVIFWWI